MKVDDNDPRPSYVQVADGLRAGIKDEELAEGQRLPSGRELAIKYGVALMTAQKAINVLRSEGLVTSRQGRGVFVAVDATDARNDDLPTLKTAVHDLVRRVSELETCLYGPGSDQ